MNSEPNNPPGKIESLYNRLDRLLLHLLTVELGFFVLLMIAVLVWILLLLCVPDFYHRRIASADILLWPLAAYAFLFPVNLVGGFIGIVQYLRMNRRDFPGTGHLINWLFIMTDGWLIILVLLVMLPSIYSARY
jgi:hypothetical protein